MKVFKFTCGKYQWAFAAKTKELAIAEFIDQTGEQFTTCEEIPEREWDKKIIRCYEDNDHTKKAYKLSIRDVMCGTDPQLIYTTDNSSF